MTFPKYKSKNQTRETASPTASSPTIPILSSADNTAAYSPAPAPPPKTSNATSKNGSIDWLAEKIHVETRARENEERLSKRISELELERDQLHAEIKRQSLENEYQLVDLDNNNNNANKLEELQNEIKNIKESCKQHLEDNAELERQNNVLLQEKVVSVQDNARLDSHVQIFAHNLNLKEAEAAQLQAQLDKITAEGLQLQEDNSALEKENQRLQEEILFEPTTYNQQLNELKSKIEHLINEQTNLSDDNNNLCEDNAQLLSDNNTLVAEISNLRAENANFGEEILKLREENTQIRSANSSLGEEISKLQDEKALIHKDFAAEISRAQEENLQLLSKNNIHDNLVEKISNLQKENSQMLLNNQNLIQEISKLKEENAQLLSKNNIHDSLGEKISNLQKENSQMLSNNTRLSNENTRLVEKREELESHMNTIIDQNKQLDSENQHLQNQAIELEQAYQTLKEETNTLRQAYQELSTESDVMKTTLENLPYATINSKGLHEVRPILVQFKGANSNITTQLQNDLSRLQKLLETFGSVKGAGKEINMDQMIPLWYEYLDTDFQTNKNTLSAALTRRILETIFDSMANGIQDPETTEDLEFRILAASDTLTDLILHFCAARGIDQDAATVVPSKIHQLVCSFVNTFGFKENEHPFIKSLAEKVQQQTNRYCTLTKKPSVNIEKLVRLAISVFYLQMRPLGVREVTFIETRSEYNELTMDDGDDEESANEVDICWFPLILAEEPFEAQTLVAKAKVVYREPSKEVGISSQCEGDTVLGRQWRLEVWAP